MQVTLIGLGGGTLDTLTQQARDALQTAPLILGAKRLLEALPENGAKKIPAVRSQDILSILQESREETACVVFSGDTGFYSGACGLLPLLLVIDGRQPQSLGATYQDCIQVMQEWGAVNAANLDGGSSSMLYYEGELISVCSSLYGPRRIPTAILVI